MPRFKKPSSIADRFRKDFKAEVEEKSKSENKRRCFSYATHDSSFCSRFFPNPGLVPALFDSKSVSTVNGEALKVGNLYRLQLQNARHNYLLIRMEKRYLIDPQIEGGIVMPNNKCVSLLNKLAESGLN